MSGRPGKWSSHPHEPGRPWPPSCLRYAPNVPTSQPAVAGQPQSVGSLEPDDPIDFAYDGQHTEFPGTVRISRDSALRALSEFMETGSRPECIDWEET